MDSVATARNSRLRLNTYSSSVRPVRNGSSAPAFCRILAPFKRGTRRLRNIHAGFPPTIQARTKMAAGSRRIPLQWDGDLSSGRIEPGRASFSKGWAKGSGDPGRVGLHSRAPGCPLRMRSVRHGFRVAFSPAGRRRKSGNRIAVRRCRCRHRVPVLLCGWASMASGVIEKVRWSRRMPR